jgi:hypothetical protein
MKLAFLAICSGVSTSLLVLALGLGPVAALLLIWIGGLVASVGLSVPVVCRSDPASVEPAPAPCPDSARS